MFGNVRQAFGTILENLLKSSGSGRKSSENREKRRHQHVYKIKRTLRGKKLNYKSVAREI